MAEGTAKKKGSAKKDSQQPERVGGRASTDTLRLWEGYREQAYLWRAFSLLQMPATALSVAAALLFYYFAETIVEVPHEPQAGYYSIKQLPDSQFINAATLVVNNIASYQPATARRQFEVARKYLWEPALSRFQKEMLGIELRTIEETKRSQVFFVNPRMIRVERFPEIGQVVVRIPGVRQKLVGNKELPRDERVYYVKMTTIPRNVHNEYGIVINDIRLEKVGGQEISNKRPSKKVR